jgi:L-amino acid N-acyltransferase YncA
VCVCYVVFALIDALQVPFTSTEEFRNRLAAAGVPVSSLYLQNEDHFATVGQLMFEQGAQVSL